MKYSKYILAVLIVISLILAVGCEQINLPTTTSTQHTTTLSGSSTTTSIPTTTTSISTNPTPTSTTIPSQIPLKVSFIDVGQADCTIIQYGTNTVIIDAGGNATATSLVSKIRSMGINKFDVVVGTHPHEDHIGGMDAIIKNFSIGTIFMPKVANNTQTFKDVLSAIQNKGLSVTTPIPGNTFTLGQDVQFAILAPNSSTYDDLNNYSIVIKMVCDNTSFLFTGDAEVDSEKEMLSKGYDLKADVLKVGHHGSTSSTSPEFLKAVSPKYGVIFVGKDNTYGHPHQATLDKLNVAGTKIYRTDLNGTITFNVTLDKVSISTEK